jgi:hypothetical protein
MTDFSKSAGIKDVAKALKISIGTVDRALHKRPGVSEKTKALSMPRSANRLQRISKARTSI